MKTEMETILLIILTGSFCVFMSKKMQIEHDQYVMLQLPICWQNVAYKSSYKDVKYI